MAPRNAGLLRQVLKVTGMSVAAMTRGSAVEFVGLAV